MTLGRSLSPAVGSSNVSFHRPFSYGPDLDFTTSREPQQGTQRWSAISIIPAYQRSREPYNNVTRDVSDMEEKGKEEDENFSLYSTVHVDEYSPSTIYDAPTFDDKRDEEQGRPLNINRDLQTRNLCILALALGYLISIACFAIGARIILGGRIPVPEWLLDRVMSMGSNGYPFPKNPPGKPPRLYLSGHRVLRLPEAAMIVVALLLNTALTLILDCINFIPSTTHRWALLLEGRLRLNSNPRLFTATHNFMPNAWYTNVLSAVALVVAYGGVSVMTYQIYIAGTTVRNAIISTDVDGPRFGLDFNSWGFIGLGIGLSIHSLLATWALVHSRFVPTWNSNPLGTAKACLYLDSSGSDGAHFPQQEHLLHNKPSANLRGRAATFRSTSSTSLSKLPSTLQISRPLSKQPPMSKYEPRVRKIASLIWLLFIIVSTCAIILGVVAHAQGSTTSAYVQNGGKANITSSDVLNANGDKGGLGYWQLYGQIGIWYAYDAYKKRRDWLGLIIQCLVLAGITLGLHCMELLTHVARDESIWRKAATKGVDPEQGAILAGLSNWPCWLLFAFKSLTHWVFGYAFSTDVYVWMNLIPMVVLAFTFLLLGAFAEFLVRHKPHGPQPVTYGDLRRLTALVDDWSPERIFWGDKGGADAGLEGGLRRAGTAGSRLAELDMHSWYVNLRAEPSSA